MLTALKSGLYRTGQSRLRGMTATMFRVWTSLRIAVGSSRELVLCKFRGTYVSLLRIIGQSSMFLEASARFGVGVPHLGQDLRASKIGRQAWVLHVVAWRTRRACSGKNRSLFWATARCSGQILFGLVVSIDWDALIYSNKSGQNFHVTLPLLIFKRGDSRSLDKTQGIGFQW